MQCFQFQLSVLEEDFIYASEFGNIPSVQKILEENPSFNVGYSDILGRTPLRLAVGNEHLEVHLKCLTGCIHNILDMRFIFILFFLTNTHKDIVKR